MHVNGKIFPKINISDKKYVGTPDGIVINIRSSGYKPHIVTLYWSFIFILESRSAKKGLADKKNIFHRN